MKLIVLIFIICIVLSFILSCAAVKPDRQEQGTLVSYTKEASNRAVLKIRDKEKEITYFQKLRGAGEGHWYVGDKYTIHFKENTILKITKNQ